MFKSWLISNLEFLFTFLYVILALVFMSHLAPSIIQGNNQEITNLQANILGFVLLFGAALAVSAPFFFAADGGFFFSLLVGLLGIIIIALGLFFVWGGLSGFEDLQKSAAVYGASISAYFIVAFIVSVVVAVFAYANFDDVVDARWLYRNSDVSIYEEEWKYALNRFAVTLVGFTGLAALLGVLIFAPNFL